MPRRPNVIASGIDAQLARRPYWKTLPSAVRAPLVNHLVGQMDSLFNYGATTARGTGGTAAKVLTRATAGNGGSRGRISNRTQQPQRTRSVGARAQRAGTITS